MDLVFFFFGIFSNTVLFLMNRLGGPLLFFGGAEVLDNLMLLCLIF